MSKPKPIGRCPYCRRLIYTSYMAHALWYCGEYDRKVWGDCVKELTISIDSHEIPR